MQEMDDQIPKIELNASLETFGINHDLKLVCHYSECEV